MKVYEISISTGGPYDCKIAGWQLVAEDRTVLARGPFLNPLKEKLEEELADTDITFLRGQGICPHQTNNPWLKGPN